jgi:hypothetical protein
MQVPQVGVHEKGEVARERERTKMCCWNAKASFFLVLGKVNVSNECQLGLALTLNLFLNNQYCECYAGSVKCSATCRCIGCKNVGPFGGPGDTAGSATGATIRPKAVRRKKSEPFQAAQNLTFLKHGSPEHQKVVQKVVRRTSKMAHDVGSMPSLASSSEGTMSGSPEQQQVARIQSKDTDDEGEGERAADKSNKEKRKGVKPVVPEQDDDVKTLLMAAYAMAEIGGGSSPAKRGNSPPQNGTAGPAAVSETSTPTFKRPRTEATTETALL